MSVVVPVPGVRRAGVLAAATGLLASAGFRLHHLLTYGPVVDHAMVQASAGYNQRENALLTGAVSDLGAIGLALLGVVLVMVSGRSPVVICCLVGLLWATVHAACATAPGVGADGFDRALRTADRLAWSDGPAAIRFAWWYGVTVVPLGLVACAVFRRRGRGTGRARGASKPV